ncbi:hypothetical protein [Actinoallomurus sp. NPDC050550]|uniref:hypothetical protein n=1 Tax=Actinoallomurus sp. NPDC050550 TaxID=3154937 RepID=UPI0033C85AD4
MPFFPPMMGGAGAGGGLGDKPEERERQTWLSEDEEVWGTRVDVGSGVIGRLDDEDYEVDETPLVGPVRGRRRTETPRRPRGTENDVEVGREAEVESAADPGLAVEETAIAGEPRPTPDTVRQKRKAEREDGAEREPRADGEAAHGVGSAG